jgi:predicted enzyme related to lactoylglutathione lyase
MADNKGNFCWYELMTGDPSGAAAFYADVVGWQTADAGYPGMPYTLLSAGQDRVAGIMAMPEPARQAGMPPYWLGYVAVNDVDASVALLQAEGGSLVHGPSDIPLGRFALARDPQGAAFYLYKGMGDQGPPKAVETEPGYVGWRELYTSDLEAGSAFYAKLFGWTKTAAMDMGPMGSYQMFAHGGEDIGGMMTRPPGVTASKWTYYFTVDSVAAAIARIEHAGGAVTNGPHQVPGGQWMVQGQDPAAAPFALVSRQA